MIRFLLLVCLAAPVSADTVVAARTISMTGQSSFTWDDRVKDVDAEVVNDYSRLEFVECTSTRGATPDVGC